MRIFLEKEPVKPFLLQGFPSFGLIGTIVTEYLVEHLKAKKIGSILDEDTPPMVAIHNSQLVEPIGIYYCEEYNLIILHIVSTLQGVEWKFADAILELAKRLDVWEILSIEGVVDPRMDQDTKVYFHTNNENAQQKFEALQLQKLNEGIIMGVGSALLLKTPNHRNLTTFLATTHSQLPDANAAASVIKTLDSYLGLKVDPQPLLDRASDMQAKFQSLMESSKETLDHKNKKNISYVG